jgi:GNAT superfamily N-acetyltransferase
VPADSRLEFDASYREEATLGDGTRVVLRLVRPADKDLLRRGFARLSAESRYLRFFTEKAALTDRDLALLTELDGIDELALGAIGYDAAGLEEGLGIARFARDPRDPGVAEVAVTVVDDVQGRGLGTLLLQRLAAAAAERGITRFSGEFLARNQLVRRLIEECCPDARLSTIGDVVRAEVTVPRAPDRNAPVYRVFRQVAQGRLQLRLRHLLLKGR